MIGTSEFVGNAYAQQLVTLRGLNVAQIGDDLDGTSWRAVYCRRRQAAMRSSQSPRA